MSRNFAPLISLLTVKTVTNQMELEQLKVFRSLLAYTYPVQDQDHIYVITLENTISYGNYRIWDDSFLSGMAAQDGSWPSQEAFSRPAFFLPAFPNS
ncbi:hypothetical protein TNCV_3448481 [Trichonephila clavipes]|nr:hypothetical protein TNCV_3448481 [Trichonephila clavipes]